MCIIVDANRIHEMNAKTDEAKPVLKWLLTGKGKIITGGYLNKELKKSPTLMATFAELKSAGKLIPYDDEILDKEVKELKKVCKSNDPHVIALAKLSGCTLIWSHDKGMGYDAKNSEILKTPASIYKYNNRSHCRLLTECRCKHPEH